MPKVSVNILTRDRSELFKKALSSVQKQSFTDYEIVVVDDGSTEDINKALEFFKHLNIKTIRHSVSEGIIKSRQEALQSSSGKYVAILDDDDEWVNADKLKKQVEFLDSNPDYVLAGGGMQIVSNIKEQGIKMRPQSDRKIRRWMLLKNPFFTSTVMFRKEVAIKAGGFIKDKIDLAEDYDLWLRMGGLGKMFNFREPFVNYLKPSYNTDKLLQFWQKQLLLICREKNNYPFYFFSRLILYIRIKLYALFF